MCFLLRVVGLTQRDRVRRTQSKVAVLQRWRERAETVWAVFQLHPTGRKPLRRRILCWRDYISFLTKDRGMSGDLCCEGCLLGPDPAHEVAEQTCLLLLISVNCFISVKIQPLWYEQDTNSWSFTSCASSDIATLIFFIFVGCEHPGLPRHGGIHRTSRRAANNTGETSQTQPHPHPQGLQAPQDPSFREDWAPPHPSRPTSSEGWPV